MILLGTWDDVADNSSRVVGCTSLAIDWAGRRLVNERLVRGWMFTCSAGAGLASNLLRPKVLHDSVSERGREVIYLLSLAGTVKSMRTKTNSKLEWLPTFDRKFAGACDDQGYRYPWQRVSGA